ncbi:MAG: GTPase Era [Alphaproteobacteria bacterium]|nr:MAG: GTPase Era [Alphaproteobacteria bacterium]
MSEHDEAHAIASEAPTRCGYVALIGEPNAGKSTLTNRLVGTKVSIVTHKVQTTRTRVRGVFIEGAAQVVIVDTPGLFRPRRRLDRAMVAAAWAGVADADAVVLMLEAHRGITEGLERILAELPERIGRRPVVAAINKIDRVKPPRLLELAAALAERHDFERIFMISAEKGSGVEDLRRWLAERMPEGPWLYPEDQVADLPMRLLAAEVTREKLTLNLHQELPYQLTVETESWQERRDGSVRIDQVVYVAREGHKGIALGPGGRTIRAVGTQARRELEEMLGTRVHLFLRVKVRPSWMEEPERYAELGLDFSDGG